MFARDGFAFLLTSPLVWFAYFLLAYLITGSGCTLGYATSELGGINAIRLLASAAGAAAAIVIVVHGAQALRHWRALPEETDERGQQMRFMQLAAALLSAASLLGVIWLMATVLVNPVC